MRLCAHAAAEGGPRERHAIAAQQRSGRCSAMLVAVETPAPHRSHM